MDIQVFLKKREQLRQDLNILIGKFEDETGILVESMFI